MKVTFTGIPSGDMECFCWDVDRETFIRITGQEPDEWDGSRFNEGLYRLYPGDVIGRHPGTQEKKMFTIEVSDEEM